LWRGVVRFQADKMTPWLALRNTLGFTLPLLVGVASGMVPAGVAVATGAFNVSFSDSHDPYIQRAKRMLVATVLVGAAIFGTRWGGHHIFFVLITGMWAFATGMLVSLSAAASDLGVISLVTRHGGARDN
jgi:hypothetical protein